MRKAKWTGRILRDKDGDEYARHKGKRVRVIRHPVEGLPRNPVDAWVQDTVSQMARTYCRAPYDTSAMDMVRKQGGLEAFVRRMLPHLSPYRQRVAIDNLSSIAHAKQRERDRQHEAERKAFEFRARRLSKNEKRKLKRRKRIEPVTAAELKALMTGK